VSRAKKLLEQRNRTLARPAASDGVSSGEKLHAVNTDWPGCPRTGRGM